MRKRFGPSLAAAPPLLKAGGRVQAAVGVPAWASRELAGPWGPGRFGTDEPRTSFWGVSGDGQLQQTQPHAVAWPVSHCVDHTGGTLGWRQPMTAMRTVTNSRGL